MKTIPLTKGLHAIVDDEDYDELSKHRWHVAAHQYAARHTRNANGKRVYVLMHREIVNAPVGVEVDHENANGLDNRRQNLRIATHRQNMQHKRKQKGGRSQHKGVWWASREKRWVAEIRIDGKKRCLGYFRDETAAAQAYNNAACQHFGEFAWLNVVNKEG